MKQPSLTQRFIEARRAEIVVLVVLPISLVLTIKRALGDCFFVPSPDEHEARVRRVVEAVRENHQQRGSATACGTTPNPNPSRFPCGTSAASSPSTGTICVEPGATVGEVTTYLLARGWMLECGLEMEDATLGGLAVAQGMTTHSHACGLVSETVTAYEVVTADGEWITVTETNEHADLFRALPMSHGTLGLLVSLKLRVVPSQPWVRLTYTPLFKASDLHKHYTEVLDLAANNDPSTPFFVESIAFGKETSVLMKGYLSATNFDKTDAAARTNRIGWWWKPWFFKHVASKLQNKETTTEYVPIREYLMRHDRSMCMTMATIIPYGNHFLFRVLLGWLLPPQMTFLKSSHTPETREASVRKQCYQDVCFPSARLPTLLEFVQEEFGIYPLLVYPCMLRNDRNAFVRVAQPDPASPRSFHLNLGIYGVPPELPNYGTGGSDDKVYPMITKVRKLEALLREVGGFQHTYCDSFQTEEEFSAMFDTQGLYREMRIRYRCEGVFPTVYEKTRPELDVWQWLREEEKSK